MKHQQPDADKSYLFVKYLFESKYQLLINKREKEELNEQKNQRHLLIIIKQLMMFMKTWKSIIQTNKENN